MQTSNTNGLPVFSLGNVYATPDALDLLNEYGYPLMEILSRHERGDWGNLDPEDWEANQQALKYGNRLFSSYRLKRKVKVWVITEADRSATTLLLPDEY